MIALLALALTVPAFVIEPTGTLAPAIQVRLSDDFYFRDPWYHGYDPFYGPGYRFNFGFFLGGHRGYRRWW